MTGKKARSELLPSSTCNIHVSAVQRGDQKFLISFTFSHKKNLAYLTYYTNILTDVVLVCSEKEKYTTFTHLTP